MTCSSPFLAGRSEGEKGSELDTDMASGENTAEAGPQRKEGVGQRCLNGRWSWAQWEVPRARGEQEDELTIRERVAARGSKDLALCLHGWG